MTRSFAVSESSPDVLSSLLLPLRGQLFTYIDTPLVLSGVNARAIPLMERVFKLLGMNFIQSGGMAVGSGSEKLADGSDIQPGSVLAVLLIGCGRGVGDSATG